MMKKSKGVLSLGTLLLSICLLIGCAAPASSFSFAKAIPEVPQSYSQSIEEAGTLTKFYYDTKDYDGDLSAERKYAIVYTPYGYDPGKQYDIIYLMHGHTGSAEGWLGTADDPTEIKCCIDHLIKDGMKPIIAVSMTYYDHNTDEDTEDYDMGIIPSFSREFVNDLMPAVESTYSTYAKSTDTEGLIASRDHRIFGGFSMGGVTTWYMFMQAMQYVHYYYPASGSLYWSEEADENDSSVLSQKLCNAIQEQGYTKDDFFVYMTVGSEDFAKQAVEEQIQSMLNDPKMFTFGDPTDPLANCAYGISAGEDHNHHGRMRDLYTILPLFLDKMQ